MGSGEGVGGREEREKRTWRKREVRGEGGRKKAR